MATLAPARPQERKAEVIYPDSDGKPVADNTLQYEWISKIKGGCDALFADRDDVFVAGDLLWYPVEGRPKVRAAPDVMVAFGRPKGYRGSYKQWEEGGIAPQVVFEILSPGNSPGEMAGKALFYERYRVEEFYIYDPDAVTLAIFLRDDFDALTQTTFDKEFVSPRLGVRFSLPEGASELILYRPDGERFKSYAELAAERDAEKARAERLAAKLRELGVETE